MTTLPDCCYPPIDGASKCELYASAFAEIERLRRELDAAVTAVRRWHKTALKMRDMSITGDGDIQDYYFNATMSIRFYGAEGDPLPSQRLSEQNT